MTYSLSTVVVVGPAEQSWTPLCITDSDLFFVVLGSQLVFSTVAFLAPSMDGVSLDGKVRKMGFCQSISGAGDQKSAYIYAIYIFLNTEFALLSRESSAGENESGWMTTRRRHIQVPNKVYFHNR